MPRYFFHFADGFLRDSDGTELPNDKAVRLEAMRTLPEVARDAIPMGKDTQSYMILVAAKDGRPIYSASLSYSGTWWS